MYIMGYSFRSWESKTLLFDICLCERSYLDEQSLKSWELKINIHGRDIARNVPKNY